MLNTPTRLLSRVFDAIDERLKQRGLDVAGAKKALVPAAFVSGNPPVQQAFETPSTLGGKTHKVQAPLSNRYGRLEASDPIAAIADTNGNRWVAGKLIDASGIKVDADYIMGLRPVEPGNTLLKSADSEVSTSSATFQDLAAFHVDRKGLYRFKCELARAAGSVEAQIVRKLRNGTVVVVSGIVTTSAIYPTFGAVQTIDMNITSGWDDILYFQLRNTSGGNLAYAQNVRIYYADASAIIVPYDAVA